MRSDPEILKRVFEKLKEKTKDMKIQVVLQVQKRPLGPRVEYPGPKVDLIILDHISEIRR